MIFSLCYAKIGLAKNSLNSNMWILRQGGVGTLKTKKRWKENDTLKGMDIIEVRIYEDQGRTWWDEPLVIHIKKVAETGEYRAKSPDPDHIEFVQTSKTQKEAMRRAVKWFRDRNKGKISQYVIFLNADKAEEEQPAG